MTNHELSDYRQYSKERLKALSEVFARASVGDFSRDIEIPEGDDEFTELYAGVQIMLECIREQLKLQDQRLDVERNKEEQLAADKALYQALLESIGHAIVATDEQGRIILINSAAIDQLGFQKNQVIGRNYFHTIPLYDQKDKLIAANERPMYQALTYGQTVRSTDFQAKSSDGRMFPISLTASPVLLGNTIVGGISIQRDITNEKEIDRAKNEFISIASHQLRTPLTMISWYGEMLLSGEIGQLSDQQRQYLREIYTANQRMLELVNALLNASRIELGTLSVKLQPTDLRELIETVVTESTHDIDEKKMKLIRNYGSDLPNIKADPHLVRMLLQNLLTNAVKYTPAAGTITIGLKKIEGAILITVADTGYGISVKEQSRIFSKFYRTDIAQEHDTDGSGLGLYINKAFVDRWGGKIWFESEEGKGTTFFVTLPLEVEQPQEVPATESV